MFIRSTSIGSIEGNLEFTSHLWDLLRFAAGLTDLGPFGALMTLDVHREQKLLGETCLTDGALMHQLLLIRVEAQHVHVLTVAIEETFAAGLTAKILGILVIVQMIHIQGALLVAIVAALHIPCAIVCQAKVPLQLHEIVQRLGA